MQAKADESFRRSQRRAMSSYSRNPVIYQNRYVLPDDFDQTPSEGPLRADHYMRNQDIIEYITGMYDYKGDWEEWASEDLGEADKYFSVPYPSAAVYELGYGRQNEVYANRHDVINVESGNEDQNAAVRRSSRHRV